MPNSHTSRAAVAALLDQIHKCRSCASVVPSQVPRSIVRTWSTDLILMAQAPSEHGVRISGVHWVDSKGNLRPPGGTYLEAYLRRVGFSIDPREKVLPRPYTTNVLQCWPGAGAKRDRAPSAAELKNCSRWWQEELRLLHPKALLLLGKPAAEGFLAATNSAESFNVLLEQQGRSFDFAGYSVPVFAVPHPTAPYRGVRGGRGEYYERAFAALRQQLATVPARSGA